MWLINWTTRSVTKLTRTFCFCFLVHGRDIRSWATGSVLRLYIFQYLHSVYRKLSKVCVRVANGSDWVVHVGYIMWSLINKLKRSGWNLAYRLLLLRCRKHLNLILNRFILRGKGRVSALFALVSVCVHAAFVTWPVRSECATRRRVCARVSLYVSVWTRLRQCARDKSVMTGKFIVCGFFGHSSLVCRCLDQSVLWMFCPLQSGP